MLKIWSVENGLDHQPGKLPGEVIGLNQDLIEIKCGKGTLLINELQIENGRRMMAKDFLCGHRLQAGDVLTNN